MKSAAPQLVSAGDPGIKRHGWRRWTALLLAVLLGCPGGARAGAVDCAALREELRALEPGGAGRYTGALAERRDEIARTREDADRAGCGGDASSDDLDTPLCRALARRAGTLETGLTRLQDRASRGDPGADERRLVLEARISSLCVADGEAPPALMPVDPDASAEPAAKPRSARVLCVRRCDGAFYPLAVDVPSDRMGDMDRICQAQCPAAASAAYAGEDVSTAVASDGSPYAALPGAFQFRRGITPACACRAPRQSWAEALAGADALLGPHGGDVTVTAALSAAPLSPPKLPRRKKGLVVVVPAIPPPDLSRAFRRSGPKP